MKTALYLVCISLALPIASAHAGQSAQAPCAGLVGACTFLKASEIRAGMASKNETERAASTMFLSGAIENAVYVNRACIISANEEKLHAKHDEILVLVINQLSHLKPRDDSAPLVWVINEEANKVMCSKVKSV